MVKIMISIDIIDHNFNEITVYYENRDKKGSKRAKIIFGANKLCTI